MRRTSFADREDPHHLGFKFDIRGKTSRVQHRFYRSCGEVPLTSTMRVFGHVARMPSHGLGNLGPVLVPRKPQDKRCKSVRCYYENEGRGIGFSRDGVSLLENSTILHCVRLPVMERSRGKQPMHTITDGMKPRQTYRTQTVPTVIIARDHTTALLCNKPAAPMVRPKGDTARLPPWNIER